MNEIIWGKHSYGSPIRRGNANTITIGNYTSIGDACVFDSGFGHRTDFISTYPFHRLYSEIGSNVPMPQDISIGSDCWLGEEVLVFAGKTISSGSVVGARSIVTKDIPPYEIWAGSPARFIRKRFSNEVIEKLLDLAWWDKSDEEVMKIAPLLASNKLDELFKLYNI